MKIYHPDYWQVYKLTTEEHGVVFKVLAGWSGSYLHGTSWKINSGIESVVESDSHWDVTGFSGSVYRLSKEREGFHHSMFEGLHWLQVAVDKHPGGRLEEIHLNAVAEHLKNEVDSK